jgi:mercuric ion transport protein
MIKIKESLLPFFGLFTSISTILCCALPIILVTLGMGAVFASLTASFPFITWLAERSIYLFAIATILLLVGGYFIFIKPQTCPSDKKLAEICNKTKKFNKIIWWVSVIILAISFFFKYILILLIS